MRQMVEKKKKMRVRTSTVHVSSLFWGECTCRAAPVALYCLYRRTCLGFWGTENHLSPGECFGSLLCHHSSKCQQDGSHVSSNITLPSLVLPGHPPDGSRCDVVLGRRSGAAKTDETGSKRPLSPTCLTEMDGGEHIASTT